MEISMDVIKRLKEKKKKRKLQIEEIIEIFCRKIFRIKMDHKGLWKKKQKPKECKLNEKINEKFRCCIAKMKIQVIENIKE